MSAFYHICPTNANFQFGKGSMLSLIVILLLALLITVNISNVCFGICAVLSLDTAFMFIIGGLFLVKIFQQRHPDINVNAFVAFFTFAIVIFVTLIGLVRG